MHYELVFYKVNDKTNTKNVIFSGTLKEIDSYIFKHNIKNYLTLCQYTRSKFKDIKDIKIISKDNKHIRDILYFDDIAKIYDKDFLYNLYILYAGKDEFKKMFDSELLEKLANIEDDKKIKNVARNALLMYPSYGSFYTFYTKYLETKITSNEKGIVTNFSYSKYRKLGELYIEYLNSKSKDNNGGKGYVKGV